MYNNVNFFFLSIISNYKSIKRVKSIQSTHYPYLANSKNPKNMIKINKKDKIGFNWLNIIDFWIIGFALIEINKTLEDKYIDWIKNNHHNYFYKHLRTITPIMILKYNRMSNGML